MLKLPSFWMKKDLFYRHPVLIVYAVPLVYLPRCVYSRILERRGYGFAGRLNHSVVDYVNLKILIIN